MRVLILHDGPLPPEEHRAWGSLSLDVGAALAGLGVEVVVLGALARATNEHEIKRALHGLVPVIRVRTPANSLLALLHILRPDRLLVLGTPDADLAAVLTEARRPGAIWLGPEGWPDPVCALPWALPEMLLLATDQVTEGGLRRNFGGPVATLPLPVTAMTSDVPPRGVLLADPVLMGCTALACAVIAALPDTLFLWQAMEPPAKLDLDKPLLDQLWRLGNVAYRGPEQNARIAVAESAVLAAMADGSADAVMLRDIALASGRRVVSLGPDAAPADWADAITAALGEPAPPPNPTFPSLAATAAQLRDLLLARPHPAAVEAAASASSPSVRLLEEGATRSGIPARISVVVRLANHRATLRGALASLSRQTHPADEVILVDDGSSDGSLDLGHLVAPNARLIRLPRALGGREARLLGAAAATSPCVAFLDAEDLWEPNCLERVAAAWEGSQDAGAVVVASMVVAQGDGSAVVPFERAMGRPTVSVFPAPGLCPVSALSVRRDAFLAAGGFAEGPGGGSGHDLVLRLGAAAVVLIEARLVEQRGHAGERRRVVRLVGGTDGSDLNDRPGPVDPYPWRLIGGSLG